MGKTNCQPESVRDRPTNSHEHIFLLSKSEAYKYYVDAMLGPNGRRIRNVWSVKTKADKETAGHFAVFPLDLIEPCIRFGSLENELVLDPFMGAGTTAIESKRLNRRFIGIELNPDYHSLSVKRVCGEGMCVIN